MIKLFCDECEQPGNFTCWVDSNLVPDHDLGAEVLPLWGGKRELDHHLCEECLSELVLAAALCFDTPAIARHKAALARAEEHEKTERNLEKRATALQAKEKEAEAALKKSAAEIAALRARAEAAEAEAERLQTLQAQMQQAAAKLARGSK